MTTVSWLVVLVLVSSAPGWWLIRVRARLDRAQARVERSWAVLDSALASRAQRALAQAHHPRCNPATSRLVVGASAAALQRGLGWEAREEAESRLSGALALARLPGLEPEQARATLARRLHNDAVSVATSLRRRRSVQVLQLARGAAPPRAFEMVDGQELVWSGGLQG